MHPLYERANKLTDEVIAAAIEVHKHFGDGLLESIYVRCLDRALRVVGHKVEHEKVVPITYLGETFEEKLRCDLLVDDCLIIEAKAVEACDLQRFRMQVLSYMKLLDKPLGLVLNFGDDHFGRRGISRVILKGADDGPSRSDMKTANGSFCRGGIPPDGGKMSRSQSLRHLR